MALIESWFNGKKIKLEKLYRATDDGFNGTAYNAKCKNLSHILSLAESEHGKKFGGYSSVQFDSACKWYADPNAFIFSLSDKKKFEHIDPQTSTAFVLGASDRIIHFGAGNDFIIYNDCDKNSNSKSNFGRTYKAPEGITHNTE
jgi:hypothetical protein